MIARHLLYLSLGLLLPCTIRAQQETLTISRENSEVHFTLGDPLHAVHGTFRLQSGTVAFDRKDGRMTGSIAVDARSGDSGNGSRDKKMTEDELKAPTFSAVTMTPKRFSGTLAPAGDSTILVDGVFTLLGTPHDISVPMQVHMDGSQCRATGSFPVPYVKWGVKDPSNFLLHVGKEVTIDLVLVGSLVPGKAE